MTSFKDRLNKVNNIDKFKDAVDKQSKGSYEKDPSYWEPSVDNAGNGFAVFRFLPTSPADGDDGLPWVKYFEHGFKGPGGWYIELSRTSIGEDDPVSDYNTKLWESGNAANRKIARDQKRKLRYVSNIYMINDPKYPENNGKQFKYRYGQKIFDKVKEKMNPSTPVDTPLDPFDLFNGANFKLKIRNVIDGDGKKQRNYDTSEFDVPGPLLGGDEAQLEAIYNAIPSLKEIVDPKNFKDYATLKQRLDKVLGFDSSLANPIAAPATNIPAGENQEPAPVTAKTVETLELHDDDPHLFDSLAK